MASKSRISDANAVSTRKLPVIVDSALVGGFAAGQACVGGSPAGVPMGAQWGWGALSGE